MSEHRRLPSGWTLEKHASLASTNDRAGEWARAGGPLPAVIMAETQTAGRGQRGRQWCSPAGAGLYASFVAAPAVAPAQSPLLTLMAGLALLDAIGAPTCERLALKWPNDVWVATGPRMGAKLAGILVEGAITEHRLEHVIFGIGLNLHPAARDGDAISLAELGHPLDSELEVWCDRIGEALQHRWEAFEDQGPGPLEQAWTEHAYGLGQSVIWSDGNRDVQGSLLGILDGGLWLRPPGGPEQVLHHGRIRRFAEPLAEAGDRALPQAGFSGPMSPVDPTPKED